jgi:hypothetical protein
MHNLLQGLPRLKTGCLALPASRFFPCSATTCNKPTTPHSTAGKRAASRLWHGKRLTANASGLESHENKNNIFQT